MAKLTPQEAAEKQARRLKASVPDIQRGIERVTESPTAKAAEKQDKMLNNLTASVQSGKWRRGLLRVSTEDWKKAALEKGVNRIANGIDGAREKVESFFSELLPYQDKIRAEISRMPDLTLEDNINRMVHNARAMADFKRTK